MTSLAAISPNAMANSSAAGTIDSTVGNNEALVSALDDVIVNNSNLISPL